MSNYTWFIVISRVHWLSSVVEIDVLVFEFCIFFILMILRHVTRNMNLVISLSRRATCDERVKLAITKENAWIMYFSNERRTHVDNSAFSYTNDN